LQEKVLWSIINFFEAITKAGKEAIDELQKKNKASLVLWPFVKEPQGISEMSQLKKNLKNPSSKNVGKGVTR
jgi:hypothetical protein